MRSEFTHWLVHTFNLRFLRFFLFVYTWWWPARVETCCKIKLQGVSYGPVICLFVYLFIYLFIYFIYSVNCCCKTFCEINQLWSSKYCKSVCVHSGLSYPECNAHIFCAALCCHVACLDLPYFPHYFICATILGERKMCAVFVSTTFIWNISHFKKNSARYCHKCTCVFMLSNRYFCQILMKLEYSGEIFENSSNIKCNNNPLSSIWPEMTN